MGHYLYARHYRVYATPPFFVPFPSLIGRWEPSFNQESIPSRAALLTLGSPGPLRDSSQPVSRCYMDFRFRIRLLILQLRDSTRLPARVLRRDASVEYRIALGTHAASDRCGGVGRNVCHRAQPVARRSTRRRPHRIFHVASTASLDLTAHGIRSLALRQISLDGLVSLGCTAGIDGQTSASTALSRLTESVALSRSALC